MRLLADMHVSPRTVGFLRALGHDVVRVNEVMAVTSTDEAIVLRALDDERVVLSRWRPSLHSQSVPPARRGNGIARHIP